jgi:hypothetical protein
MTMLARSRRCIQHCMTGPVESGPLSHTPLQVSSHKSLTPRSITPAFSHNVVCDTRMI